MMPKGVEHSHGKSYHHTVAGVRIPMMPKGVEHHEMSFLLPHRLKVRIPMMPKGVEHVVNAHAFDEHRRA